MVSGADATRATGMTIINHGGYNDDGNDNHFAVGGEGGDDASAIEVNAAGADANAGNRFGGAGGAGFLGHGALLLRRCGRVVGRFSGLDGTSTGRYEIFYKNNFLARCHFTFDEVLHAMVFGLRTDVQKWKSELVSN